MNFFKKEIISLYSIVELLDMNHLKEKFSSKFAVPSVSD